MGGGRVRGRGTTSTVRDSRWNKKGRKKKTERWQVGELQQIQVQSLVTETIQPAQVSL